MVLCSQLWWTIWRAFCSLVPFCKMLSRGLTFLWIQYAKLPAMTQIVFASYLYGFCFWCMLQVGSFSFELCGSRAMLSWRYDSNTNFASSWRTDSDSFLATRLLCGDLWCCFLTYRLNHSFQLFCHPSCLSSGWSCANTHPCMCFSFQHTLLQAFLKTRGKVDRKLGWKFELNVKSRLAGLAGLQQQLQRP